MLNIIIKNTLHVIAIYIGIAALFGEEALDQLKSYMVIGYAGAFDSSGEMSSVNLKLLNLAGKTVNYSTQRRQLNNTSIKNITNR